MFSSKYTERHWEIVRDYLVRSYFEDVSMPSFSTTSEDEDANNARSTSSGELPPPPPITLPRISPLPELIIEKVNHDSLYDDPEEFYDNLEAKVNKLIDNIKRASQCDDVNDQDTIKIMDTSQDITTDEEHFNFNPNGHIRNVTYTIINDFSTETDINDCNSATQVQTVTSYNKSDHVIGVCNKDTTVAEEYLPNTSKTANSDNKDEEIYYQSSESTINAYNKNTHSKDQDMGVPTETNSNSNNSERDFMIQNSDESYEESITFTVEENKKPDNYCYNSEKKSNNIESNKTESFESQNELVSAKAISDVHSVPAIHTTNLLHALKTVDASNSPILGITENKNKCENSNSEDSNTNYSSGESPQQIVHSQSDFEESTDMERLETILEEGESQLKDINDRSNDDFEERNDTLGSKSQNDSRQETNANVSNDPETMRATNRNSFRTTRFSFITQETDNELDIFYVPNKSAKKHLEIQQEIEEIEKDCNLSHEEADLDSEANTNVDFVTSTPKSGNFNYSVREINAASPELVNKSQQCEIDSFETNTRKRRANNTVCNENDSMTGEDCKSKWESLKGKFFVGAPKIYRLCNCKHHSCS